MPTRFRLLVFAAAIAAFSASALIEWHPSPAVRRAVGIVAGTLVLWIAEVAPLGVTALGIPVAIVFSGLMPWREAIASWGDPVLFLFLGAFLLARALDKHGVFDWLARSAGEARVPTPTAPAIGAAGLAGFVLVVSGVLSLCQNNTAVAAMLLPAVTLLARRTLYPPAVLLALAYGATLGGMALPVGTAPNFIGYGRIRELDPNFSFVAWMRVGVPVWIGTTAMAWLLLVIAARRGAARRSRATPRDTNEAGAAPSLIADINDVGPARPTADMTPDERRIGRGWALALFAITATTWLFTGVVQSLTVREHGLNQFVRTYLPEELVPLAAAWGLFMVRIGPRRRAVLDRHDFQALDWDTLFLIAGGMCLGAMLKASAADRALAEAVGSLALPPWIVLFALAGATILLSELTSNTATASLLVPIAASLAPVCGVSAVQAVWMVALCASLGFALPVSTPPNALVYGTRLTPLRTMAATGIVLDVLAGIWVVLCVKWFG